MPITYFAQTNFRRVHKKFGIKLLDRLFHFYVIGKTGTGKTTLLKTKIIQDIINNRGVCFFDPHGDAIADIVKVIPSSRKQDLLYLDLTDPLTSWGYNPLRKVPYDKRSLVCGSILSVFERLWINAWGMKLEHILRMVILTLLDLPYADLGCINKILLEEDYRNSCLEHIQNEDIKKFWIHEFPKYKSADLLPILSKTGGFLSHPIIKRIFIENKNQLSLRKVMDSRKILFVNLAKGSVGTDVAHIVGSLILTTLASASFSRIDIPENKRIPFLIYLDEFQNLTNEDLLCEMLSELRKFKIGLVLCHQFLNQISIKVREAILGNVGTIVSFRLGISDARIMSQEFNLLFDPYDFTNLPNTNIYLRLMIDGKVSHAFSASTFVHYSFNDILTYENSGNILRRKTKITQAYSATHSRSHNIYRKFRRWFGRILR